uniref:Haloacid dehalogenase-like hydrolase domain-containing protein 2 n=1 Tax=Auxenochlorella protothecoides TaxID=3075 RepID=A0A1D2AE10_AUXPR
MRFKAALIDLSGTLHIDGQAIPGAVAALERLRAAQLPCRFVTNTTKDTVDSLVMTLQTLGFGISKDEVFSSLSATRQLLKQRDLRPLLLLDRRALPEFDDVPQHDPNAVVVGLAREAFNYDSLNRCVAECGCYSLGHEEFGASPGRGDHLIGLGHDLWRLLCTPCWAPF